MSVIVVDSASSTLVLNGRVIEDIPQGDTFTIAYPNEISTQTQGINNGLVAKNRIDKDVATLTLRVLRYRNDDAFFTNQINTTGTAVFNGSLKVNFTRDGVDGVETHSLSNGTIQSRGDNTKNNQDGDEIQEYVIQFGTAVRSL